MTLAGRLARLPPRDQARLIGRISLTLSTALTARGEDVAEADAALALVECWARGEPIEARAFSDAIYDGRETGVLRRLTDAEDRTNQAIWNALVTAVSYVAWLACQTSGEPPPPEVSEVDETTPGLLEAQWRATPALDPAILAP